MKTPSESARSPQGPGRSTVLSLLLALPLALAGTAPAQEATPDPPGASLDEGLPEVVVTRPKAAYREHADALALLEKWAAARPDACAFVELGETHGGRPLRGLLVGRPAEVAPADAENAATTHSPLTERPVVLLVGGIDGRSLHGSEAVLAITAELLTDPAALPADLAFLCLPWAAPDGLDAELAHLRGTGPTTGGRNARPRDEDLDGLVDEDGPDDLDGDGLVTSMLVPDPAGPWRRASDPRFLVDAEATGATGERYRLVPEGRDDDNDGDLNEDGPGGVRVDRNFPIGWRGPNAPFAPGPWPLSEPESTGLAAFVDGHDVLAALFFDGHSGAVEYPIGRAYDHLGRDGQPGALPRPPVGDRDERRDALGGLFLDVFAAAAPGEGGDAGGPGLPFAVRPILGSPVEHLDAAGIPALRLATWGPRLGLGRSASVSSASFRPGDEPVPAADELEDFCDPGCPRARGTAWREYLDNRRGGIGFVDWHPVELAGTGTVLVGGWEAASIVNPPEDQLGLSVDLGLAVKDAFLAALPRFEVEVAEVVREGGLVTLRVAAGRLGDLPASFLDVGGLELALELPPGARLVAGPPVLAWQADEPAPEAEWLVHADEPGAFRLVLRTADGVMLSSREVRP